MASSRKPKAPFPADPEEGDSDWDEDEQPTVARASRMPTAPVRMKMPSEFPTAPGTVATNVQIDMADDNDIQNRVTTAPQMMPPDDYARLLMANEGLGVATDGSPPPSFEADASEFGLALEAPAEIPSSDLPTAPPPIDFMSAQIYNLPPASSVESIALDPGSLPTDYLPPAPPLSEPRADSPAFSGRFSSAPPQGGDREQLMKDRFAMGDFSGSLELAEQILVQDSTDTEANSLAQKCREVLEDMYVSRISDVNRVPRIIMGPDQIRWLSLNHRAGFLLSMIDSVSTVDDILDISGMQRLDALRIICSLLEQKVISLD